MSVRDLIIVGAGPSGLSAAIAAKKRGLDYQVLEQGVLVNSIYRFPPQMVFFTTPELLEIGGLPFVSPYEKPTRAESLKYYRKVVDSYDLQIAFEEKVLSIQRENGEGAGQAGQAGQAGRAGRAGRAGSESGAGEADQADALFEVGVRRIRLARFVVLAVGYYDRPNLIHVPGENLPHVSHYYHEPHPHYRQRVVIVGGGNSAAEAALEMYRAGVHVTLVHRWPQLKPTIKYWVRPDIENRIKEGSIAARFGACVKEIRPASIVITPAAAASHLHADGASVSAEASASDAASADHRSLARRSLADGQSVGGGWSAGPGALVDRERADAGGILPSEGSRDPQSADEELSADAVYLLTGYRADMDLMCRAGVRLTEREGPVHDPETFETNVRNLFVAGGAIAGMDTGTIFIENGRFHGETIVEVIAGRC
jgi:thioredoxin reductase (NADPH)